ncbi:hypothetical protein EDB85DRAFT_165557 [Lactarius pseudohatsudake]|nr:hypothetical protein EDB85DRAFT_165557 [Lactarius pseudohatsudake]
MTAYLGHRRFESLSLRYTRPSRSNILGSALTLFFTPLPGVLITTPSSMRERGPSKSEQDLPGQKCTHTSASPKVSTVSVSSVLSFTKDILGRHQQYGVIIDTVTAKGGLNNYVSLLRRPSRVQLITQSRNRHQIYSGRPDKAGMYRLCQVAFCGT